MDNQNGLLPMIEEDPAVGDGANVVEENDIPDPTIDLEWYRGNYIGLTRILRLEYVAEKFPKLRIEALKLALMDLKGTCNVDMYQKLCEKLTEALNVVHDPTAAADESWQELLHPTWLTGKSRDFAWKSDKLMNNLRSFMSSNIKENVRRGYNDLGDHHLDSGDLNGALKYYTQAWNYSTSGRDTVNTCINKIRVGLLMNNWTSVLNYVSAAEHLNDFNEVIEMDKNLQSQLKCGAAIAELGLNRYKASALSFLQLDINYFAFPDMVSSYNIATYAGLCALATFERPDLHKHFIQNSPFKPFLELEPEIRDVIHNFYNSKYSLCLKKLSDIKGNLLMDMYFAPHVENLFKEIRVRGILQYFSTYSKADMVRMADAFNTPYNEFREELINLIMHDKLPARIDSVKKLLVANEPDYEAETYERVLEVCDRFEKTAEKVMLRALFKEHNVLIR